MGLLRAGKATVQSALQSEVGSLCNRFNALCSETTSVLGSGASAASGSLSVWLQEANARTAQHYSEILRVLSTVRDNIASAGENFADTVEAVSGRLGSERPWHPRKVR